jgi:hypothetical protein
VDRRLDGPQSRSGRGAKEKNSHPLPGLEPLIIQPVGQSYTTELSRLLIRVIFLIITDQFYYPFLYINTIIRLLPLL